MFLETEEPVKQCYGWQKRKIGIQSWAMEVKEELHNIGLAFVWRNQQELIGKKY
jgi:hypothetical protein